MTITTEDLMQEAAELREQAAPGERHSLHITNSDGDARYMWDPSNREEVAVAKAAFKTAKKKGMLAYAVDPETGGRTGEVIQEFDETKGKIIMVRQTAGG